MNGEKVDAFVAGVGTGGTITGAGECLKQHYGDTKIVAVEPATSAVLIREKIQVPHKIQGIGAGFKPKVLNMDILDSIRPVSDDDAYHCSKRLGKKKEFQLGFQEVPPVMQLVK